MRRWLLLALLCIPAAAVEKAAYDSNGRIVALLSDAEDVDVATNLAAVLPSGKRIPLQVRIVRDGDVLQGVARKGSRLHGMELSGCRTAERGAWSSQRKSPNPECGMRPPFRRRRP